MPERSDMALQRLAGLREQRKQALLDGEVLAERVRQAVADAQAAGVSMAKIARTLDIDRSTLYRVYAPNQAA